MSAMASQKLDVWRRKWRTNEPLHVMLVRLEPSSNAPLFVRCSSEEPPPRSERECPPLREVSISVPKDRDEWVEIAMADETPAVRQRCRKMA